MKGSLYIWHNIGLWIQLYNESERAGVRACPTFQLGKELTLETRLENCHRPAGSVGGKEGQNSKCSKNVLLRENEPNPIGLHIIASDEHASLHRSSNWRKKWSIICTLHPRDNTNKTPSQKWASSHHAQRKSWSYAKPIWEQYFDEKR